MIIKPKNWSDFQHYKDRCPPWIKLHKTILDDYDFHTMQDASKALAMCLWLVASENLSGEIDATPKRLAFRFRQDERKVSGSIIELIDKGFFIVVQDDSNLLAACKQVAPLEEERRGEAEAYKSEAEERTRAPESPLPSSEKTTQAGDVCRIIKAAGIPNCNPSHPDFLKLLDAGATQDEFYHATQAAIGKGKASFAYVLGMVKGQREDAAKLVLHQGAMPTKPQSGYAASMERTRQQVFGSDEEVFGRQIFSKGELENGNTIDAE